MAIDREIPEFKLYGEARSWPTPDLIYCEPLVERSKRHNWKISPHRHAGITQFFYLRKGSAEAHMDGIPDKLIAPCVLVVPENCVHDFSWSEGSEGQVISVAASLLTQLSQQLGPQADKLANAASFNVADDAELIDSLFQAIVKEYQQRQSMRTLMLESLLQTLFIYLCRRASPSEEESKQLDRSRRHFSRFMQMVEDNFTNQRSVTYYAEQLGITASHLNSICQRIYNHSALEIIHERLLLEAKRQLIYTGKSISGIADLLGFSDPAHFTRFFKNKSGQSPKAFRKASGLTEHEGAQMKNGEIE